MPFCNQLQFTLYTFWTSPTGIDIHILAYCAANKSLDTTSNGGIPGEDMKARERERAQPYDGAGDPGDACMMYMPH